MRILVYAICKNESAFVRRWMASMSEADGVYVLDTGSTDDSAALLTELARRHDARWDAMAVRLCVRAAIARGDCRNLFLNTTED